MAPPPNDLPPERPTEDSRQDSGRFSVKFLVQAALVLFIAYAAGYYNVARLNLSLPPWLPTKPSHPKHVICRPPLPPMKNQAFDPGDYRIQDASLNFDAAMRQLASLDNVDSVTVAIVTPDGPVFSKGYGVRRANETEAEQGGVDENTVYRLASVSKMFAVLELWILKERGALEWDDDITRYLPQFRYYPGGWAERERQRPKSWARPSPITLRQIASHMSGIPRDFPPAYLEDWPNSMKGAGLPHYNGRRAPSEREIFEAIRSFPLAIEPYSPPLYSNTGYALLGMAALSAHRSQGGRARTFAELLQHDIFDRLHLNGSSFLVTEKNKPRVAVAKHDSDEIDVDIGTMNPAYGQLSSVADLVKVMQTFLDPSSPNSLISPYSLREWLRPSYAWIDDMTEVGLMWEILKIRDSYDRKQRVYQKLGEFMGHKSGFAFNPTSSFGVIVLMTGWYGDTEKVVTRAFNHFQPAFDSLHETNAKKLYAGTWKSEGSSSTAVIGVKDGSLWMNKFTIQGSNILAVLRDDLPEKVALTPTGREGEFRLAKGYRPYTGKEHYGCMPLWVINDPGHSPRGAPVDIIYFTEDRDGTRTLHVPSSGISLKRVSLSCPF